MGELANLIENIKSELLDDLKQTLEPLALADLAAVTEAQEEFLRGYLEAAIIKYCGVIFPGAVWSAIDHRIHYKGDHYEAIVREGVPRHDTIEIWFVQRDLGSKPRRPRSSILRWNASGKYERALLFVPPDVAVEREWISDLVSAIFYTGYAWYEEQLHKLISDDKVTAKRLYSFLRTIISNDEILGRIWLVSSDQEYGCYLVDDRLATAAMKRVRPKAGAVGKSAIRMLSEFITCSLPFNITHSKGSIQEKTCVDVDLMDSQYSGDRALFMAGEIAFYGSQLISIFPIVKEGSAYLLAVFPTQDRPYLETIFSNHEEELAREFAYFRGSLTRLLEALRSRRRGLLNARLGEFAGGVLTGVLKSLGTS